MYTAFDYLHEAIVYIRLNSSSIQKKPSYRLDKLLTAHTPLFSLFPNTISKIQTDNQQSLISARGKNPPRLSFCDANSRSVSLGYLAFESLSGGSTRIVFSITITITITITILHQMSHTNDLLARLILMKLLMNMLNVIM